MRLLPNPYTDPNRQVNEEAVIHKFARKNNYDLMLTLLLYSDNRTNINMADERNGNTALHIAAQVCQSHKSV